MKKKSKKESVQSIIKEVNKMLEEIRQNAVFVEGKKDKEALIRIGSQKVFTISGNLRLSCEKVKTEKKVIILTDLDRRGLELLKRAVGMLEEYGVKSDHEIRNRIAHILRLKYFENLDKKYEKFMEENSWGE